MKIHNPNNLDVEVDLSALRAMVRGDLDPVRQALEERRDGSRQTAVGRQRMPLNAEQRDEPRGKGLSLVAERGGANFPAPAGGQLPVPGGQAPMAVSRGARQASSTPAPAPGPSAEEIEARRQLLFDRRKVLANIIKECEALEVLNPETLALRDYPQMERLMVARKWRDLWFVATLLCAAVAAMGWFGLLGPWLAGVAAGGLVFGLSLTLAPVRQFFLRRDHSLPALLEYRRTLEFRALNHIRLLEGRNGLAWHCQAMREQRPSLAQKRYQRMAVLSRQGLLLKAMRNVGAFRFYLQYLLEAREGFAVVKREYLEVSAALVREFGEP